MKKLLLACLVTLSMLCSAVPLAHADVNDFTVTDFSADYYLNKDDPQGELRIVEHIKVYYTDFNHGFLRALPNDYNHQPLKLDVHSVVSESGAPAKYTTYQDNGNTVLKIGDPNQTVTGNQSYTLDYSMQNVVTFYNDHDELYWNTNGTQWQQPFDGVKATFHMPDGVTIQDSVCYTGAQGNKQQSCTITKNNDGITAVTARRLQPYENMTVVMSMPKGTFAQPTAQDWWKDNIGKVLAVALPPLIIGAWAYTRWYKNGRDLKGRGTVIAEYDPPTGIGPAEAAVLMNYRLDAKHVSAVIIDLAIRKYIKIIETTKKKIFKDGKEYTFKLLNNQWENLKSHETDILSAMFLNKTIQDEVELSSLKNSFYKTVNSLKLSLPKQLTADEYFPVNPATAGGLMWGALIALVIAAFVFHSWISYGLGISALLVGMFAALMPRRTAKGVEAVDILKGLKLYMNTAEKDRIKMLQSPDSPYAGKTDLPKQTVELFEKLLPYAMVLGVEQEWAKQFTDIYKTPPDWYSGNWNAFNAVYLTNSLNQSVSAMGTSFSPPQSSGSSGFGGGGFSGGGGGGGGGGGW